MQIVDGRYYLNHPQLGRRNMIVRCGYMYWADWEWTILESPNPGMLVGPSLHLLEKVNQVSVAEGGGSDVQKYDVATLAEAANRYAMFCNEDVIEVVAWFDRREECVKFRVTKRVEFDVQRVE